MTTHDATGISFQTSPHERSQTGGWLNVTIEAGKNKFGQPDTVEFRISTWSREVFDHFRDIERIASGPIGSLSYKPPEEEAPQNGDA